MPCGDTLVAGTVLAAVGGVLVVLVFLILWFRRAIKRLCMTRLYKVFRYFTGARVKLLISTYQIIAAVMWGVPDVRWPEPFSTFGTLLEMLKPLVYAIVAETMERQGDVFAAAIEQVGGEARKLSNPNPTGGHLTAPRLCHGFFCSTAP